MFQLKTMSVNGLKNTPKDVYATYGTSDIDTTFQTQISPLHIALRVCNG